MTQRGYASEIVERPDDPYPVYDALRASGRMYFSPTWKCWVLSHYRDIAAVLLSPEVFSSRGRELRGSFPKVRPGHHLCRGGERLTPNV